MYPINTVLTFTSLTHASAAADLFGRSSLESLLSAEDLGLSLFDKRVLDDHMAWEPGFFPDAEQWRIILDTPEKVRWFEPQGGDKIEAFVWSDDALICVSGIFLQRGAPEQDYFDLVSGGIFFTSKRLHRIAERNGHPFPQPQDVKPGETV
jgi:hypothetical protein